MFEVVLRVVVSLGVVLLLFWAVARVSQRRLGLGGARSPLRVLGRQALGRNASVAVVEVGERVLVVGVADSGVRLLTELDPDELPATTRVPAVAAAGTGPGADPATGGAAPALLEGLVQIGPSRVERGDEAEQDAGGDRHQQREAERGPVHPNLVQARNVHRGPRGESRGEPHGEQRPADPARQGEQDALGQELAHHPAAACTQRGANRGLAAARRRLRELEIGDVGAGNEQEEPDGAQQHEERPPRRADEELVQRRHPRAHDAVRRRVLLLEPPDDGLELRIRLLDRHARTKARDGPDEVRAPEERLLARRRGEGGGLPHVHFLVRKGEPLRHHADDLIRDAVQQHRAADDGAVAAEVRAPRAVADDGDSRPRVPRLLLREDAAENRTHADDREEVAEDVDVVEQLRLALAGERRGPLEVEKAGDVLEGGHLLAPVEHVGGRGQLLMPVLLRILLPEHDEPSRLLHGERLEHHRVHGGEDHGVGPDAERERHDRGDGERGRARERPEREAGVGDEVRGPLPAARLPMLLARDGDAAERDERASPRLVRREAQADVLLGLLLEVETDLVVQLAVGNATARDGAEPRRESPNDAHAAPREVVRWWRG